MAKALASKPTGSSGAIRDVPLHPLLRNIIGRMFSSLFDVMTIIMYCMCKVYAAPKSKQDPQTSQALVKDIEGVEGKLMSLEANGQHFEPDVLYAVMDKLPTVRSSEMVGKHYRGVIVHHRGFLSLVDKTLVRLGKLVGAEWGKHYASHYVGHPLVLRKGSLCIPIPIWGNVCNLGMEYRGRDAVATMIYDSHPWKDYFVRLGARDGKDVLLGVWETHGALGGFFTLTEE